MTEIAPSTRREAKERRRSPRVTVLGVLGEVFLTAGFLVLAFLGWQIWLNDIIVGSQQQAAAEELSNQWETPVPTPDATDGTIPDPEGTTDPAIMPKPAALESFANLIVPRLGDDYVRRITEGIGFDVLNNNKGGVGHYPKTQMPGEYGNFAIAAHRTTYGRSFHNINEFRVGDSIWVESNEGWYRYVYRNTEYVQPTGVGVLNPIPQETVVETTDRIITLTSCNPYFSAAERIIAYGVFDRFFPRAEGQPAELAALAPAGGA